MSLSTVYNSDPTVHSLLLTFMGCFICYAHAYLSSKQMSSIVRSTSLLRTFLPEETSLQGCVLATRNTAQEDDDAPLLFVCIACVHSFPVPHCALQHGAQLTFHLPDTHRLTARDFALQHTHTRDLHITQFTRSHSMNMSQCARPYLCQTMIERVIRFRVYIALKTLESPSDSLV